MPTTSDDLQYRLLKLLDDNPQVSQREIAQSLGLSVGKANYCLQELIKKGHVKVENFRKRDNKLAYAYILTPTGLAAKVFVTRRFLKRKLQEFSRMQSEIFDLKAEIARLEPPDRS